MSFTDDSSLEDFDNADAAEIDSEDVKSNLEENSLEKPPSVWGTLRGGSQV